MTDAPSFTIPADVAEHVARAANVMTAHSDRLKRLFEIWGDIGPDPYSGEVWMVCIDHPEVTKLIENLGQISEFLSWLSAFAESDAEGQA